MITQDRNAQSIRFLNVLENGPLTALPLKTKVVLQIRLHLATHYWVLARHTHEIGVGVLQIVKKTLDMNIPCEELTKAGALSSSVTCKM